MSPAISEQNSLFQGEMLSFMKIPKAFGKCLSAKPSSNWPSFKIPSHHLLKVLYTQRGNDQNSNKASQHLAFAFPTGKKFYPFK